MYKFNDLRAIMELLRSENGCPWDKEQTHKSIRNNFIEETYEVVEAIDNEDSALLREELGDVLLQVIFHCRISEEAGEFSVDEVIDEICKKLIERHPHIFADVKVENTGEVLKNWEAIKQEKKGRETIKEKLEGVSKALPALMRAAKLSKKSGMEIEELEISANEESIGEELFKLSAYAEKHNINAEQALFTKCERFIENFLEN
ncbi:MAG: MazG family protein [Oscillospiraceae bacterium]|nr:MazG family protein [Oscillospiraceae bacterium]